MQLLLQELEQEERNAADEKKKKQRQIEAASDMDAGGAVAVGAVEKKVGPQAT